MIKVGILIDALRNIPNYSDYESENWVYNYYAIDPLKSVRLVFIKDHENRSWKLLNNEE